MKIMQWRVVVSSEILCDTKFMALLSLKQFLVKRQGVSAEKSSETFLLAQSALLSHWKD